MNSQFDFFILTTFLFSSTMHNRSACHTPVYVLSFQFVYFQQTPPPYQSRYSPTTNIIDYLDPGTMPQQNSTIIISTTVLKTVSSSQFTNHLFIPGEINPNLSNTLFPGFPNSPFVFIFLPPRN